MLRWEEALALKIAEAGRTADMTMPSGKTITAPPIAVDSQPVEKKPWLDMPAGAFSFTQTNIAAVQLPAIGTSVDVVSFLVPAGMNGVITGIANQFVGGGWEEGSGALIWSLQADGAAIRGYEVLIASLGTTASPGDRSKNPVRIFENQLVKLVLQNVNILPAGQFLLGLLTGYFYPIASSLESEWL